MCRFSLVLVVCLSTSMVVARGTAIQVNNSFDPASTGQNEPKTSTAKGEATQEAADRSSSPVAAPADYTKELISLVSFRHRAK